MPALNKQGAAFTEPLLGPDEALVGFSVDDVSTELLFSAVDYECRVDGLRRLASFAAF